MVFFSGTGANGLAVILDARTKTCRDIGETLTLWGPGNRYLGRREWNQTLRIALRDHGTDPLNMAATRKLLPEVRDIIKSHCITTVVMVQSPVIAGVKTVHSAWNLLGRSGNPYKWAGTVLEEDGLFKCPVLHPQNYEYAYNWLIHRWFMQALALAKGRIRPMPWPTMHHQTGKEMYEAILRMAEPKDGAVLSVDIETSGDGKILTALGLARNGSAVSIPWDGFKVAGSEEWEPSLDAREMGAEIRAAALALLASDIPKVGHNFMFDVFQLQGRGYAVGGEIHDTLLLARVAFPQFRRGLQQVAAMEYCIEPWKSAHKTLKVTKDEDKWLSTPVETRIYNCKDAYVTGLLFDSLMERLEK